MRWLVLLVCACGRIGFDAQSRAGDGATDTTISDGMTVPAGPGTTSR